MRAIGNVAVHIGTVVYGALKEVDIGPAHGEVAMQTVPRVVAVGPNPCTGAVIRKILRVGKHFVEDGDYVNGVGCGAVAAVVHFDGVGHV